MPQVLVLGVVGLTVDLERNVMRFGVIDFFVTALDVPFTPRSDDLHIRCESLDGKFKPNLVVALAGAAVADGVRALFFGDLDKTLCDNRTCKARAEHIFFIQSTGLDGRDDEIVHKFIRQILDVQLGRARRKCLFFEAFELVCLADIARNGDDFAVVIVFL